MISRREFIASGVGATAGLLTSRHLSVIGACQTPIGGQTAKSSYIRLYDEAEAVPSDACLQELADAMTMTTESGPPKAATLLTGYTYFGQFIDHDLTWNDIPYDASKDEQLSAPNRRSPFLDLDSVYGNGPPLECQFSGEAGEESFVIDPTLASPKLGLKGGSLRDIPFEGKDGNRPVLGDRVDLRNAENLILRQLHVVFLKFHNRVIEQLRLPQYSKDPLVPQDGTLFERARQLVTWTYQWLVWNNFLNVLCPQNVPRRDLQKLNELPSESFRLPLEFVTAAFRFGHSMVQGQYELNCHHAFKEKTAMDIQNLINPSKESAPRLSEEYVIEWSHFFAGLHKNPIRASKIDTHINPALGHLQPGTFSRFTRQSRDDANPNLPYRTLVRGARARLASGQQVARRLEESGVQIQSISQQLENDEYLRKVELTENTPLWYYILKEAEIPQFGDGDTLGKLGFYIVETTMESALQNDPDSFLIKRNNGWTPPSWILPKRQDMSELIKFAGVDDPAEGCTRQR